MQDTITPRAYRLVVLWAAGILLLYAIGGYFGIRQLQCYKAETEKLRQATIGAPTTEQGMPLPKPYIAGQVKAGGCTCRYVYQQHGRVRRQRVLLGC